MTQAIESLERAHRRRKAPQELDILLRKELSRSTRSSQNPVYRQTEYARPGYSG
jgi:hypothetical protein